MLRDLGLDVGKADILDGDEKRFHNRFYVQNSRGGKITDAQQVKEISLALEVLLKAKNALSTVSRPKFDSSKESTTGRMNAMMGEGRHLAHARTTGRERSLPLCTDTYRRNDVLSIQEGIVNHVEYTMARSRWGRRIALALDHLA